MCLTGAGCSSIVITCVFELTVKGCKISCASIYVAYLMSAGLRY